MSLDLRFKEIDQPARAPHSWHGCSAETVMIAPDAEFDFAYQGNQHYLAVHDITLRDGELNVDGFPAVTVCDIRDTLTFVPKGCGLSGWSRADRRDNKYTAIYFDADLLHRELGQRYLHDTPPPSIYVRDAGLLTTMRKIANHIATAGADDLLGETLCMTAALEVFSIAEAPKSGALSSRQFARVREFIDSRLGGPINLSDLAEAAGLSRFHFLRAFKITTGQTPHRFITALRIERAIRLLSASDVSLDEIARAAGFANDVQFRRTFHGQVGLTPSAFRRTVR